LGGESGDITMKLRIIMKVIAPLCSIMLNSLVKEVSDIITAIYKHSHVVSLLVSFIRPQALGNSTCNFPLMRATHFTNIS